MKNPASTQRSAAAFTLVEVMMATAILVVGFIGLIQAITIGSEALDTARKQQVARQIFDGEVERLRASSWNFIASGTSSSGTISIDSNGVISGDPTTFALSNYTAISTDDNTQLSSLAKGFTCTYTRTYLRPSGANASNVTYLKFVYTITWISNTGRMYSRRNESYFGKNGLSLSYQKS